MTYRVREYTCRVLEAVEDQILNKDMLIDMMLVWMSESDVQAMCEANDICLDEEEEEEGPSEQSMWYDTSAELT